MRLLSLQEKPTSDAVRKRGREREKGEGGREREKGDGEGGGDRERGGGE